jgi:hypothetical protein
MECGQESMARSGYCRGEGTTQDDCRVEYNCIIHNNNSVSCCCNHCNCHGRYKTCNTNDNPTKRHNLTSGITECYYYTWIDMGWGIGLCRNRLCNFVSFLHTRRTIESALVDSWNQPCCNVPARDIVGRFRRWETNLPLLGRKTKYIDITHQLDYLLLLLHMNATYRSINSFIPIISPKLGV